MNRRSFLAVASATAPVLAAPVDAGAESKPEVPGGFAPPAVPAEAGQVAIDGLQLYYEVHGSGSARPLVLLHGGFMSSAAWGPLLSALAADRRVVAFDLEGHGRTRDLERPLSTDQMGRDVAAAIRRLDLGQVDLLGFSMGGMAAQRTAFHAPELVRRLVLLSTGYDNAMFSPALVAQWPNMSPEGFKGTPMEGLYRATAPDPARWPVFVGKMRDMMLGFQGWPKADLQAIKAPTLLALGDTDLVRLEYAVEMFRLLGGAPEHGGMGGPAPASRFAILPATTHFDILFKLDLLMPMLADFLDGPKAA